MSKPRTPARKKTACPARALGYSPITTGFAFLPLLATPRSRCRRRLTSARSVRYVRDLIRVPRSRADVPAVRDFTAQVRERLPAAAEHAALARCRRHGVFSVIHVAARQLLHPEVHDEPVPPYQKNPLAPSSRTAVIAQRRIRKTYCVNRTWSMSSFRSIG
jgi:hypothetical protein